MGGRVWADERESLTAVTEGCDVVFAEREHLQTAGRDFLFLEVQQRGERRRLLTETSQLDVTLQRGTEALVGG